MPWANVEPSTPLPTMIFSPLVAAAIDDGLLKNGNDPILAAGVLRVVVVHIGLGVPLAASDRR